MKKVTSTILILSLLFTLPFWNSTEAQTTQSREYSLAVLNFAAIDGSLSPNEVLFISSQFTEEMAESSLFTTMAHEEMERQLLERNLDPSNCAEISCGLESARILDVQLVMLGTIEQLDNGFQAVVNLVHVASGSVVRSEKQFYAGGKAQLIEGIGDFARTFSGAPRRRTPEVPRATRENPEQNREETEIKQRSGFKWYYLGLGLVIAGGVGAGVFLVQKDSDLPLGPPDLPEPPKFP